MTPPTMAPTLFEAEGLESVLEVAPFVAFGLVEVSVGDELDEVDDDDDDNDAGGAVSLELLAAEGDVERLDVEPVATGTLELGLLTGAVAEVETGAGGEVVDTTEPLEVSESVFAALAN